MKEATKSAFYGSLMAGGALAVLGVAISMVRYYFGGGGAAGGAAGKAD